MGSVAYLQIFALYFSGVILYFLPGIMTYKLFAVILAIITFFILGKELIKRRMRISKLFCFTFALFLMIAFCYRIITPLIYNAILPTYYEGEFLAFLGQTFPGVLTAIVVSQKDECQRKMKKYALFVSILFSFVALVGTISPTSKTTAGYANNDNNLNYQSLSYLASYGACLSEYAWLNMDNSSANKKLHILPIVVVLVDFFTILISGGRGGLVAFLVFLFFTMLLYFFKYRLSVKEVMRGLIVIITLILGIIITIKLAFKSNISTSGLSRIVGFLNNSGDSIRENLRDESLSVFIEKPILGHGFGSVFFEIGFYSHNFITDLLVETGLVGLTIVIFTLLSVLKRLIKLIKLDFTNSFWLYLFFCGIIELTFSGYYLASICTWWVVFFVLSNKELNHKSLHN